MTLIAQLDQDWKDGHHERRRSDNEGSGARHQGRQASSDRLRCRAVIETYDFIGFGTAAALYFGHAFFPNSSPLAGTLLSFATLGVGFVARPLGGIIGGHLGDKVGRKPVLVASLILMGLATFAIGLLPTYAAVGVLAPILLVTVRIIQGLAFGAEWGGAILMSYEHAPWKKKGRYTGIVQRASPSVCSSPTWCSSSASTRR